MTISPLTPAERLEIQIRNSLKRQLHVSGIRSYLVEYENGHRQIITSKIPVVTEGKIIPHEDGQIIKDLAPIFGRVAYIHGQPPALQRERIIEEVRAQANLAGSFHAVHKLVIDKATPSNAPLNERYVPFRAIPVFIQKKTMALEERWCALRGLNSHDFVMLLLNKGSSG